MDQRAATTTQSATPLRRSGALQGICVIDLTRLAPGPYCTMLLADMGAEIVVVGGGVGSLPISALARGKQFVNLDLKKSRRARSVSRPGEDRRCGDRGLSPRRH